MGDPADERSRTNEASDLRRPLDLLMTEIATDLMDVSEVDSLAVTNRVLDRLIHHFGSDDAFLRRHREDRVSELVTIRPARPGLDHLERLAEMSFDKDPAMAMTEHMTKPLVMYPGESREIQAAIKHDLGVEGASIATVPLRYRANTVGILSLVRFSTTRWSREDVQTLFAVATLFAQFWSRLEAERSLAYKAHFDDLTGLANRSWLLDLLTQARHTESSLSLLVIDIDNMKAINDSLGMEFGDRYLSGFGRRLANETRSSDLVARLSGDQFAVLATDGPAAAIEHLATRLVSTLRSSVDLDGIKIARSVSIGIAHWNASEPDKDPFAEAGAALHVAKRDGRNRYRVYDKALRTKARRRFEQEVELRQAIEGGEFVLHYQPALDLLGHSIAAVEALVRWNHPSGELLVAGSFIETAEETGLIVEIGDVVMAEAMMQLSRWQPTYPDLEMWVNVSPAQLMSRDVPKQVADLAHEHGVDLRRFCLEVTEHAMLEDLRTVTGALEQLRSMGVRLALDDFGTGYSSMKQLKDLPIDVLKIDKSFVAGLGASDRDGAIVDAAITLAGAFNLDTVAEGVETTEQLDELVARGCHQAQGFLLARPQDANSITALLDTTNGQRCEDEGEPIERTHRQ